MKFSIMNCLGAIEKKYSNGSKAISNPTEKKRPLRRMAGLNTRADEDSPGRSRMPMKKAGRRVSMLMREPMARPRIRPLANNQPVCGFMRGIFSSFSDSCCPFRMAWTKAMKLRTARKVESTWFQAKPEVNTARGFPMRSKTLPKAMNNCQGHLSWRANCLLKKKTTIAVPVARTADRKRAARK